MDTLALRSHECPYCEGAGVADMAVCAWCAGAGIVDAETWLLYRERVQAARQDTGETRTVAAAVAVAAGLI